MRHSKLIIAWGNNVTWSNLHLTPLLNAARKDGAKVVVIDPKRIKIAEQSDLHIALKPGTDVVLAWAVAAELERRGALDRAFIARHVEGFEEFMTSARRYPVAEAARICGVPEAEIRTLAEWYHTLSPAAISVGNGLERNQNGGSGIRAIFALPALAGKFGVPGGGLVNGAGFVFPKTPAKLQRPDFLPAGHAHAQHRGHGQAPARPHALSADQGALRLQPQSAGGAPGPEPDAPRPRPRGPLRGGLRTW